MKKVIFMACMALFMATSMTSCREENKTQSEELIDDMQDKGADIEVKDRATDTKIKMETEDEKVKIKEGDDGDTKIKVKEDNN
jgi:ABC-type enterochelin transport system substrate-binding protein